MKNNSKWFAMLSSAAFILSTGLYVASRDSGASETFSAASIFTFVATIVASGYYVYRTSQEEDSIIEFNLVPYIKVALYASAIIIALGIIVVVVAYTLEYIL
ncbi:MAG: hypothetical protein AAF668_01300 [Pseudomonadota bacterium]